MQNDTSKELYHQINQNLGQGENWHKQGYYSPYVLNEQENRFITHNYIAIIRDFGKLCSHYLSRSEEGVGFRALLSHLNGQDSGRIRWIPEKIFKQMNFAEQIAFLDLIGNIHDGLEQIRSAYCMGIFEKLEQNPAFVADFTQLSGLEKNVLGDTLCLHLNTMFHSGKSKIMSTTFAFQNLYSVCLNHQIRIDEHIMKSIPECAKEQGVFDGVLASFADKVLISQNKNQTISLDQANYMLKDFTDNFQSLSNQPFLNTFKKILQDKKQEKQRMIDGSNLFLSHLNDARTIFQQQIESIEKWETSLQLMMDVRKQYRSFALNS